MQYTYKKNNYYPFKIESKKYTYYTVFGQFKQVSIQDMYNNRKKRSIVSQLIINNWKNFSVFGRYFRSCIFFLVFKKTFEKSKIVFYKKQIKILFIQIIFCVVISKNIYNNVVNQDILKSFLMSLTIKKKHTFFVGVKLNLIHLRFFRFRSITVINLQTTIRLLYSLKAREK